MVAAEEFVEFADEIYTPPKWTRRWRIRRWGQLRRRWVAARSPWCGLQPVPIAPMT